MNKRTFLKTAFSTTLGLSAIPSSFFSACNKNSMTVESLNAYLRSQVEVDEPSVDKIIIGDPEMLVKKIGTAWMPYWNTLKKAKQKGINAMVVHEPTFYTHRDLEETKGEFHSAPESGREKYQEQIEKKKKWIEENEMAIIRCHDVLDKIKGYGIPFAFGRALGFDDSEIVRSRPYFNVYKTKKKSAVEMARTIASKLKSAGQPGVAFYGNENFEVETIGLGTGCICNPLDFMDLEPDMYIAIDDVVRTWVQTSYAEDTGKPLVVINHGTSEEFGMKELSDELGKSIKNIDVIHFEQGCTYKWITSS